MPPKRILIFLAAFLLVTGWIIAEPILDRATREAKSLNTTPNASPFGYKGLYLLMQKLEPKRVAFWDHSMMKLPVNKPQTVLLLEPGDGLFFDGEAYTKRMRQLVEQGYNLIFVLNEPTLHFNTDAESVDVLRYLNQWYDLDLNAVSLEKFPAERVLEVQDNFSNRSVETLHYKEPQFQKRLQDRILAEHGIKGNHPAKEIEHPELLAWSSQSAPQGETLLAVDGGAPLVLRFSRGKGSITVFPDAFFLKNGQLDKGDNAALAVALLEGLPEQPILFEGYSVGFNDNKDVITTLATGKGVVFLSTMLLLLALFCLRIANQPQRRKFVLKTSDERHFTQETFIAALGQHYLNTHRWNELYNKLLSRFEAGLKHQYPGYSQAERLERIAQSPFVEVSLEELQGVFTVKNIPSEELFVHKCQQLLRVQREVLQHEHNRSVGGSYITASYRH